MKNLLIWLTLSASAVTLAASASAAATSQPALAKAQVYVIHGIPGQDLGLPAELPVDIAVNGTCALTGVTFGAVAGPLPFPPGQYTIEISPADPQSPCSQPAIITATVDFASAENATVIAHLDENLAPTASKFTNDLSSTESVRGRILLHHTAAAPAVDVSAKYKFRFKTFLVPDVKNGDQLTNSVLPGPWRVSVLPAGTTTPVLGPVSRLVKPRTGYMIYVVGSLANGTLSLIVNPVPLEN